MLRRTATGWTQEASLNAPVPMDYMRFGNALAISHDGDLIAIGAEGDLGAGTGINGSMTPLAGLRAGAVYLFARTGTTWALSTYIKSNFPTPGDNFGFSVALSADGTTLVVGAPGEDSNTSGINGNENDNTLTDSGAAFVYRKTSAGWSLVGYLKQATPSTEAQFGFAVAASGDGSLIACGAVHPTSATAGTVTLFTNTTSGVAQQFVLTSVTPYPLASTFGRAIALSADGQTLAVGAPTETVAGTSYSGFVFVFLRSGTIWTPGVPLTASRLEQGQVYGATLALSANGAALLVAAPLERGYAGRVYSLSRTVTGWTEVGNFAGQNTDPGDQFGMALGLSADGRTALIGAAQESSAHVSTPLDNSVYAAGAAYVFER